MAAYRRVYDSRFLQADCQELGSAPEPYAQQSSMGYIYLFRAAVSVLVGPCCPALPNCIDVDVHTAVLLGKWNDDIRNL